MKKTFIIKLTLLIFAVILLLYFLLPDINIILAAIDKQNYTHIRLFHTNDMHGYVRGNPRNKLMGMAKLKYLIDVNSLKSGNNLVLDCGDTLFGTNETDLNDGKPVVEIMNKMHYAGMAIGNHEFDFGEAKTLTLAEMADFPFLSANLYYKGKLLFKPYTIVQVGSIRLGIIALSTEDLLTRTKPEFVQDLFLKEETAALGDCMEQLQAETDFVILLAHELTDNIKHILDLYSNIRLVLAGHEHIALYKPLRYKQAYIASTGSYTRYLGQIDLVFRKKQIVHIGGKLLSTIKKRAEDPQIKAIVDHYYRSVFQALNVKVGETLNQLGDAGAARHKEINLGNAITDAMREYLQTDIAIQNGGGIRVNIPRGDITLYQIHEVFPFINYVIEVEMTGRQIKEALEHGIKTYPSVWNGGFLQVSGLQYTFDAARPSGRRLVSVTVQGKAIEDDRTYSVATNDFLYQGGDGYNVFKNVKNVYNSGLLIEDIFKEYVQKHQQLNTEVEGRIVILNEKK